MVEIAYGYADLARIAWEHGHLGSQSEINAALSVEILLKSLLSKPVENIFLGTVRTNFECPRTHNLMELYQSIPEETKNQLKLYDHENVFSEKKDVFLQKRYIYEPSSKGDGSDLSLLHTAAGIIPKIVDHFLEHGCQDPWLIFYKSRPDKFKLPTGIEISVF